MNAICFVFKKRKEKMNAICQESEHVSVLAMDGVRGRYHLNMVLHKLSSTLRKNEINIYMS